MQNKWVLPKMFDMSNHDLIVIDTETNGLDTHYNQTLGVVVTVIENGKIKSGYYPYGHDGGPQYAKRDVMEWLDREVRGKKIAFHHSHYDIGMLLNDGLDLRKYGNQVRDTMIDGPLLDADGFYSLDAMAAKYIGKAEQKVKLTIPKDEFELHPSHAVGTYAEQDGTLTMKLLYKTSKEIERRGLTNIRNIELDCVPAVVEMVRNGLKLDREKLFRWIDEVSVCQKQTLKEIDGISPNSGIALKKAFDERGIRYQYNWTCENHDKPESWAGFAPQTCPKCEAEIKEPTSPHFGKAYLLKEKHPFARNVLKARQYHKLLNTFLKPWSEQVTDDGTLYFQLHQLRDRDRSGGTTGTVSGRFSASMMYGGAQPQQIWNVENQLEEIGDDFIVRELFVAEHPDLWVCSWDASQIEYRVFAHFSGAATIIDAYKNNPDLDYHQIVADEVLGGRISRKKAKNINFGKLFGMGYAKLARQLQCSRSEAIDMYNLYDEMLPEAKDTINKFSRQASKDRVVRTLRGREFTFPPGARNAYIAMNRVVQGTAADLNKEALKRIYDSNILHKMRLTVHDEIMGDIESKQKAELGRELLEDVKGVKVPILWKTDVGKSWGQNEAEKWRKKQR